MGEIVRMAAALHGAVKMLTPLTKWNTLSRLLIYYAHMVVQKLPQKLPNQSIYYTYAGPKITTKIATLMNILHNAGSKNATVTKIKNP